MGGGATMRAVAKAAGVGVFNTGIRGRLPENSVSAATRAVARPVPVISAASSVDSSKQTEAVEDKSVQKSVYEIDDWEFAGFEEEVVVGSGDKRLPRVVFGGAPTLEEAKEATSELKEVLEKAYLCSPTSPIKGGLGQDSSLSCIPSSEILHNNSCLAKESVAPTHAIQAFKFLNESPAVQAVVASIASDPNVWNSVLKNPALQDYLQAQRIDFSLQPLYPGVEESSADAENFVDESPVSHETLSQDGVSTGGEYHKKNELHGVWDNISGTVVDWMNHMSDFFQNLFGGHHSANKNSTEPSTAASLLEKALGPSLMGLVIMVIMMVVLRRPSSL